MNCEIRSYIGTRSYQEDSAAKCETDKGLFCVVCDGIGSRKDGGASSKLAVDCFIEMFKAGFSESFPEYITKVAEKTDRKVYESYGSGCGTTVTAVCVKEKNLSWLSVGDSRLYILRNGRLRQITTDHDYAYVLRRRLEKGIIDQKTYDAEIHKGKHLASFIGMGGIDIVDVSMKPLGLNEGDMLLLSTDGLYKSLGDERIEKIMNENKTPTTAADTLISAVKSLGGNIDNTTLAVIGVS